jgi:hypothetical protein
MNATRGIRSLHVPVLFAAMVGLAVSASGCIIDASSGPSCGANPAGCYPDLTIFWEIRSMTLPANPAISCDQAGGADTVVALIDGGCLGSNLVSFTSACPVGVTGGSFVAPLPNAATYNVSLELHSGGAGGPVLSATDVVPFGVDCTGASATPTAPLFVNFPVQ